VPGTSGLIRRRWSGTGRRHMGCPACPAILRSVLRSSARRRSNVNGLPALRVDDTGLHGTCLRARTPWTAKKGAPTVFINGKGRVPHETISDSRCGGMKQLVEGSRKRHHRAMTPAAVAVAVAVRRGRSEQWLPTAEGAGGAAGSSVERRARAAAPAFQRVGRPRAMSGRQQRSARSYELRRRPAATGLTTRSRSKSQLVQTARRRNLSANVRLRDQRYPTARVKFGGRAAPMAISGSRGSRQSGDAKAGVPGDRPWSKPESGTPDS